MRLLARRAAHELRAAGARPRRTCALRIGRAHPRRAPRRRARRAGHSNRDIAQRLYVTQRTVETHLTHAFQKLDIPSRTSLARVLLDEA